MNILMIQLRQLGDILLTTPMIRAIKAHDPHANISFLTHPMGKLILSDNELLSEHLIYPPMGFLQQAGFMASLRRRRFDVVFDFMGNPRSALLAKMTGAPERIGFQSPRSWAYTKVVPRKSGEDYIVKEKFRMLAAVGIEGQDERLMLPWKNTDLDTYRAFVAQHPEVVASRCRVTLSPTHRREDRRWGSGKLWAQLADTLVNEWHADVIWLWGPGEEEFVRGIQALCTRPTHLAPKTTFRELAALIAQCELFIGTSNGPSHVAVAVNTPSLQLHGPTDAPSWSPMTARHRAVARRVMTDIALSDVLEVLSDMQELVLAEVKIRNQISSDKDVWIARPEL